MGSHTDCAGRFSCWSLLIIYAAKAVWWVCAFLNMKFVFWRFDIVYLPTNQTRGSMVIAIFVTSLWRTLKRCFLLPCMLNVIPSHTCIQKCAMHAHLGLQLMLGVNQKWGWKAFLIHLKACNVLIFHQVCRCFMLMLMSNDWQIRYLPRYIWCYFINIFRKEIWILGHG